MDKLRVLGLHGGTIERLHLGLKQAYVSRHDGLEVRDALSYPLLSDDGLPIGRYAYRNLQGITTNPQHPKGWGPGPCTEYRLGNGEKIAVVAADVLDLWLAWQTYGQTDGPAGSGKSELGEAIARVAINGTLAGQLRAAGMVRLLDQTHGLLVLDDMDGTGAASVDGDSEIAQALKSGYKRSTARKPVADRAGRIRIVDYFGPKMITRTKLPKPILGSRMIAIHTAPALGAHAFNCAGLTEEKLDALRDELHCWALASANHVLACYQELREHHKCRWDEITSPLLAISDSAGSDFFFRVKAYIDCDSSRCSHREL